MIYQFFKNPLTLFLLLMTGIMTNTSAQMASKSINLVFVDHLKAGLIEQDVFVEKVPGTGMVYRVQPLELEKYMDAQLYSTTEAVEHDPFNARHAGPYKKGKPLGMTLKEWLTGSGTATYTCEDGWGQFEATFENLVPNATYTIWHFFMGKGSTDPFNGTLDLPLGDRDGTQSVFTTDEKGNGKISIRFEQCLQLGDVQLASAIAVAYHSDGNTYGALAGDFGTVTHVQLFAMLPDANDVPEH